jgi:hypothetical protein
LFRKAAAASLRLIGLARGARPGSKSRASTHGGSPRNLGGPDVSVGREAVNGLRDKVLVCERACPRLSQERSDGAAPGTAKRRKTKRGGTGVRKS